ncbi:putative late blight resistance protein homolog R1A-3 [Coffea eugenioides]|uniref:putative late blight resistance protein homolog R1A-3 n=1 Tax=Coffea eugenioides TaxID=49369 RepID=UPI000F6095A7|nr:putative late blight resistance protein homolog R1A-3 [Coffea eugenioides]XP_027177734.1 putative late blight resistance protein homolog R1A-3 [Coffea eugenioides]
MASSSSGTSCFESALTFLDEGLEACRDETDSDSMNLMTDIRNLMMEVRLLKTFDLYFSNCMGRDHETLLEHDQKDNTNTESESLRPSKVSCRIQELVNRKTKRLVRRFESIVTPTLRDIKRELTGYHQNIKLLFETDIKELSISKFLDDYSLGQPPLVTDFIDSLSENLRCFLRRKQDFGNTLNYLMEILEEKLMFLKSFIPFATLQGVEGQELRDLLNHVEDMGINAARLISICWFNREDKQVCDEMVSKVSQLLYKINPVDPQDRATYINVLTASKLSKSSDTLALEKNKHIVADFIDCLLDNLMELLQIDTNFLALERNQLLKLQEGVRFLNFLLRQQGKFNELHDEIKGLIGDAVCDAGVVIFSLSKNQLKEGFAEETDLELSRLLKKLNFILTEVAQIYPPPSFRFPRTNELGSIDLLLQNVDELATSEASSIAFPKDQIQRVQEDLQFLRSFLQEIMEQRNQNKELQALWDRVMEVTYNAELVIDSIVIGDKPECLDNIVRDIKLMRAEALEVHGSIRYDTEAQSAVKNCIHMESQLSYPAPNEVLVGLDEEVKMIINRLTRGSKHLNIVPIVGMAGLGKTTFANKVYCDPSIIGYFHIRAWCTVSQVYSKHNLLAMILCSINCRSPDHYLEMNEDDLTVMLYQSLKRNRYLIILDDVWDIKAWNMLERSLPDDTNGSRILFTSRFQNLTSQFSDCEPFHLRQLTVEECFVLLQRKIFGKKGCLPALIKVLTQIANKCKGLPFTVVIVAGILSSIEPDCWQDFANSLSSSTVIETNLLELGYSYLPDYLKPCLLYFGTFPEDENIPVRRLFLLWVSEGFVQKTEGKTLEDVADDYLKNLVNRSLVIVTQQRTIGGAKACRIHDLVREFCVTKAKEESFLHILHGYNDLCTFAGPCNPHRVFIYDSTIEGLKESKLFFPNLRCLLFRANVFITSNRISTVLFHCSLGVLIFKFLRLLDLGEFSLGKSFPMEVVLLVHLRYLAIRSELLSIPDAIANLSRLETLLIRGSQDVRLPNTIWTIKTLRHLFITRSNGYGSRCGFIFPNNLEGSPDLEHLVTLTLAIDPSYQSLQKILKKLPSIRRLRCAGLRYRGNGILMLDHLSQVESLKVHRFDGYHFHFPSNLRKLTLSFTSKPWSEISTIGKLTKLEVLKLNRESFVGRKWEMKEGEFPKLRILKLSELDIRWWTATSSDHFSCLEKLALHGCKKLEELPSCLGESAPLVMIEVKGCESAESSVKQIGEEQMENGNEGLKIDIRSYW